MGELTAVPQPDLAEICNRFAAFEKAHQVMVHHARVGALVVTFTNEELHLLVDMGHLTIGDVLDLRRLGLLNPDEGWTGGPRPKTKKHPRPAPVPGDKT